MVTAVILINVDRDRINEVAEELVEMDGVSEVYSVSGRFDLIAIIRVRKNDDLAHLVTKRFPNVQGIAKTETLLAFQAYSRHDLDSMFFVGMDE